MAYGGTRSSSNETFDPTAVPDRWLDCPRKSNLIHNQFLAFKTPLDSRFRSRIHPAKLWNCSMLISNANQQKTLGLVIDLTNTERFYNPKVEFEDKNIRYKKIRCRGHGECPNQEQVQNFINTCREFLSTNPTTSIGVHCTHGFNRTGFLICVFLHVEYRMSINDAIKIFAEAREPGIYKQDYLDELVKQYGEQPPRRLMAPARPSWCQTDSDPEDEPAEEPTAASRKRPRDDSSDVANRNPRLAAVNPDAQFAEPLRNVHTVHDVSIVYQTRLKCQRLCDWNRNGFPGSQPVSMDTTNFHTIFQSPYKVSWKADGTRYMMLIEDKDQVFMFDRDNSVFRVNYIRFPENSNCIDHLRDTLVDGEFVIDIVGGARQPRYLIYDIIAFNGESVMSKTFTERTRLIEDSIIKVRNDAFQKELIDRSLDPFSVRLKPFYDLSMVHKLLGDRFKNQICHAIDGLIFQPELDPYTPGRSPRVFKWKEDNTIDFRLKITTGEQRMGELPRKRALLMVSGLNDAFAEMPYEPSLRKYDGKIIECSYRDNRWQLYRERTDKSYPNARDTATGVVEAVIRPLTKEVLCAYIDKFLENGRHGPM